MATGHPLPGYGNIVSGLRRTRSAGPGAWEAGPGGCGADPALDQIREQARAAWSAPQRSQTSYQDHFRERTSLMDEQTRSRPTSGGRRNKPHPPLVFLTCALHTVPGYHNADAMLNKDMYKVDGILPPEDRQQRATFRKKYATYRPSTAALGQYQQLEGEREFALNNDPVDMPDIWQPRMVTPVSPYRDHGRMGSVYKQLDEDPSYDYQPQTLSSHHRYLRPAGYEESMYLTGNGQALGSMRATDRVMAAKAQSQRAGRTHRGDFLMHPEWTPNFAHHRLNGLSPAAHPHTVYSRRW